MAGWFGDCVGSDAKFSRIYKTLDADGDGLVSCDELIRGLCPHLDTPKAQTHPEVWILEHANLWLGNYMFLRIRRKVTTRLLPLDPCVERTKRLEWANQLK